MIIQKNKKNGNDVFPLSAALYTAWKQQCIDDYQSNSRAEFQLFKFRYECKESIILYSSKMLDNGRSIEDHIESRKNNIYILFLYMLFNNIYFTISFYSAVHVISKLFDSSSRSLSSSIPFSHAFITNNNIYKDTIEIFAENLVMDELQILLSIFLPGKVFNGINAKGDYSSKSSIDLIKKTLQKNYPENYYNVDNNVRGKEEELNTILRNWTKTSNNSFKLFKKVLLIMNTNFEYENAACKVIIFLLLKLNNVILFRCSKPSDNNEQNCILCKICKVHHFW